jgi:hypothetical protein
LHEQHLSGRMASCRLGGSLEGVMVLIAQGVSRVITAAHKRSRSYRSSFFSGVAFAFFVGGRWFIRLSSHVLVDVL